MEQVFVRHHAQVYLHQRRWNKRRLLQHLLNLTATKALIEQLPLAYQLAKNLQDTQNVKIYYLFCLISEICYTFPDRSGASDRKRLGRWSVRWHCRIRGPAAWNIANFVMDGCVLTHAGANLQRFGNVGDRANPCMLHPPGKFQADVLQTRSRNHAKASPA